MSAPLRVRRLGSVPYRVARDLQEQAHGRAGDNKPMTLGHPEFEGFQAIQEVETDGTTRRIGAE